MPLFYHYTDDEGAQQIIRTGRVKASLKSMSRRDATYGNGVYLTQLKPVIFTVTKKDIAINNWKDISAEFLKKTKNYFIFDIPESDVTDIKAEGRNIFLYGFNNDLLLHKYPWCLKNFNEKIAHETIASYKYKLMSLGPAATMTSWETISHKDLMGDYTISEETVNERPIYVGPHGVTLSMCETGDWLVTTSAGERKVVFGQFSNYSLGPDQHIPLFYFVQGLLCQDDSTLKLYAWQV